MNSKLFTFCVHVHACVDTRVCMVVYTYVCACVEDRSQPVCHCQHLSPYYFEERSLSGTWSSPIPLGCLVSKVLLGLSWPPQHQDDKHTPLGLAFYVIAGVRTQVPCTYALSTSPIEYLLTSPSSHFFFVCFFETGFLYVVLEPVLELTL